MSGSSVFETILPEDLDEGFLVSVVLSHDNLDGILNIPSAKAALSVHRKEVEEDSPLDARHEYTGKLFVEWSWDDTEQTPEMTVTHEDDGSTKRIKVRYPESDDEDEGSELQSIEEARQKVYRELYEQAIAGDVRAIYAFLILSKDEPLAALF